MKAGESICVCLELVHGDSAVNCYFITKLERLKHMGLSLNHLMEFDVS